MNTILCCDLCNQALELIHAIHGDFPSIFCATYIAARLRESLLDHGVLRIVYRPGGSVYRLGASMRDIAVTADEPMSAAESEDPDEHRSSTIARRPQPAALLAITSKLRSR